VQCDDGDDDDDSDDDGDDDAVVCFYVVDRLPPKYSLSADGRNLTVFNVCRDCADNTTDLQVIQCNASNRHGYAFAAGYLNVLRMIFSDLT